MCMCVFNVCVVGFINLQNIKLDFTYEISLFKIHKTAYLQDKHFPHIDN